MEGEFRYAKPTSEEFYRKNFNFFEKNNEKVLNNEVKYSKLNLIDKKKGANK